MSNIFKLNILPEDRILVVSPHPDDESFGCGGLLLLYGKQIDVLLVADGKKSHGEEVTDSECLAIREQEFKEALSHTNVRSVFNLRLPDLEVTRHKKEIIQFDFSNYNKVFIPNRNEEHPDHRAINEYVRKALRKQHSGAQVFEYEVWGPMAYANYYLDISPIIRKKDDLISCYSSQLSIRNYHAMVLGLNAYRGVVFHTEYAEAYELISLKNNRKKLFYKLPISLQAWILQKMHKL